MKAIESSESIKGPTLPGRPRPALAGKKPETILIVDDMPANIDILVHMLKDHYSLRVATDGVRGLEIAHGDGVDLILLDVMMPKMNGFEVCEALKWNERTREVPVIFITALQEAEYESFGFSTGAVDYITKPFIPSVVEARIAAQLELSRQRRALALTVEEQRRTLEASRLEVLRQLARAAELRDNETGLHVVRVSHYSYFIARAAGLDEETAHAFRLVAPLHDVGKIGVPDHILLKEGKLTDEEWRVIRTHCELGYRIIGEEGGELIRLAALCAYRHHERWDGSGYPGGLAGEEIPLVARVLAIADVFDALTSSRPYKRAWSIEEAVRDITRCSGSHFDPALVLAFLEALPDIVLLKEKFAEGASAQTRATSLEASPCTATSRAASN